MWKRIWALFKARNKEFFRDKSALGWTYIFPFLLIAGFSFMFNEDRQTYYKVGVIQSNETGSAPFDGKYENFALAFSVGITYRF